MNNRYLYTLVENREYILQLSKCNKCPFFNVDIDKIVCICKKSKENDEYKYLFVDDISFITDNIKKPKYLLPDKEIDIPDWCELSSDSNLPTGEDISLYYKRENKIIKRKMYPYTFKNILKIEDDKVYNNDTDFKLSIIVNSVTAKIKKSKKQYVCSACGEKKIGITRKENLGMCLECWDLYNNDFNKKYTSYINNFRLKRKSDFINTEFKMIKEL